MLAEEVVDLSPKSPMVYDPQTGEVRELTQDDLREIVGAMTGRKMTPGRPSIFSDALACEITSRLAAGESLRTICRADDMPSMSTIFRWLADERFASFREQYARSREAQADAIFEEILDIADDATNDWMERHGQEDIGWQANGEHIQRSRLRVDARKWMAGKLAPKKYGERIQNVHTGEDGGPVKVMIQGDDKGLL